MTEHAQNISISVIGSGNVATHLTLGLFKAGVKIDTVYSPQQANRTVLAEKVNAEAVNGLDKLNTNSNFYLISVPDDKIETVAKQIPPVKGIVMHTSGMTGLDAVARYGKNAGVFYPLQTFSKQKDVDLINVPFCLEGTNEKTLAQLEKLAKLLSRNIYRIDSNERKYLHLAAVFASNFVNYMYNASANILQLKKLPFDLMKPLIEEVAEKIKTLPPSEAQTGPARRNDTKTMEEHRRLLSITDDELLEVYNLLTEQIIKKYHEL